MAEESHRTLQAQRSPRARLVSIRSGYEVRHLREVNPPNWNFYEREAVASPPPLPPYFCVA
jgi:hypothetical protein